MSKQQLQAAAALLASCIPARGRAGWLFAATAIELALVGGPVRDVFLGRRPGDLDLTTDAPPQRVLEMIRGWADQVWTIGIGFGTVGLRKGSDRLRDHHLPQRALRARLAQAGRDLRHVARG